MLLKDWFDDLSTVLEDSFELPDFEVDKDRDEIRVDVFLEAVETVEFYIDDDDASSSDEIHLQDSETQSEEERNSGKWMNGVDICDLHSIIPTLVHTPRKRVEGVVNIVESV